MSALGPRRLLLRIYAVGLLQLALFAMLAVVIGSITADHDLMRMSPPRLGPGATRALAGCARDRVCLDRELHAIGTRLEVELSLYDVQGRLLASNVTPALLPFGMDPDHARHLHRPLPGIGQAAPPLPPLGVVPLVGPEASGVRPRPEESTPMRAPGPQTRLPSFIETDAPPRFASIAPVEGDDSLVVVARRRPGLAVYLPAALSFAKGSAQVFSDWKATFVDGAGGKSVFPRMWQRMQPVVDGCIVVSLDEVKRAMRLMAERARVISEGAGALGLAAALTGKAGKGPIVAIVSGGNIDLAKFSELISA